MIPPNVAQGITSSKGGSTVCWWKRRFRVVNRRFWWKIRIQLFHYTQFWSLEYERVDWRVQRCSRKQHENTAAAMAAAESKGDEWGADDTLKSGFLHVAQGGKGWKKRCAAAA